MLSSRQVDTSRKKKIWQITAWKTVYVEPVKFLATLQQLYPTTCFLKGK